MIILPKISDKVVARPGIHDFEVPYHIPNMESFQGFWKEIYEELQVLNFYSPVGDDIDQLIDPDVGYFGPRSHPADEKENYYHIGVEMKFEDSHEVRPIASAVLEYSGYGAINGYYVLLSHPQIQTEDGYVLHSMYCHLKKPLVHFNSYQKMLREISLGSYPIINIKSQEILGMTGSSGVVKDDEPKLYLQMDFRKYGETPIALDPLPIFTGDYKTNSTAREMKIRNRA